MIEKKLPAFFKEIDGEIWFSEDERNNMRLSYRVKEIISSTQSVCQQIDVIDSYDFGKCLLLDGVIQTTELDGYIYNEMISHIPVVTHAKPEKVLVIGGGDCGAVNEIIKYPEPQVIDMVEIDELVVKQCISHMPEIAGNAPVDPRVNFIFADGVEFVKDKPERYDVVIVDSSDPVGPAVNLFSEDFYTNIRCCLKEDGLMACQSQSPVFHRDVLRHTHRILNNLFPIVRTYTAVIPSYPGGMWSFTIASLKHDPRGAYINRLAGNTRYINQEIFEACFKLPEFFKEYLI